MRMVIATLAELSSRLHKRIIIKCLGMEEDNGCYFWTGLFVCMGLFVVDH